MSKRFLFLLAAAFLIRLCYVYLLPPVAESILGVNLYPVLDADGYLYYSEGFHEGDFWFGEGYLRRMPYYPGLLAFFTLLPLPTVPLIQFWHILLDLATLSCIYLFIRKYFGETAALFSGACYAIYPLAIYRLVMIGSEVIHTTALAFFVLGVSRFIDSPKITYAVGLSILTLAILFITPVFQFFAIFVMVCFLYFYSWKRGIAFSLAYLVPILLLVLLWGVRNYETTGQYYLFDVRGGREFWLGNHVESNGEWEGPYREIWESEYRQISQRIEEQGGTKNDENRYFYKKGIQEILSNPLGVSVLWVKKFFRFWYIPASKKLVWLTIPIQTVFLGLGLYGFMVGWKRNKHIFLLVPVIGYYAAIYTASYACIRFSHPIMPWVCALAGIGLFSLYNQFRRQTQ